jgi:hypothetical protein
VGGPLFIVAGALTLLGKSMNVLERVDFIVGAVGWLLLALNGLLPGFGALVTVALILALIGNLAAGIHVSSC